MPELKVGDKVRFTRTVSRPCHEKGEVATITSIGQWGHLRVNREQFGHPACVFEPVVEEPTPKELADEFRSNVARQNEILKTLFDQGFIRYYAGAGFSNYVYATPEKFSFRREVKTVEEL